MIRAPGRRAIAIAVLALWVAGLAALWFRRDSRSEPERLAEASFRLDPETYFYTVSQSGVPIGIASSALDTTPAGIRITDLVRARALVYGDSQSIRAVSTAYLSRGFALDSFALSLTGDPGPLRIRGTPKDRAGVLLPTIAPIALVLGNTPRVGLRHGFWIFSPLSRRVERVTLEITAESLLTVVDSAQFDSTSRLWIPAHSDSIRAWHVTTPTHSVSAWVDARGRALRASEPGGLSIERTAYEIAALNLKTRLP